MRCQLVSALLKIGQGVGRPIIDLGSDKYRRLNAATICTLACGLCCFAFWIPAEAASSNMCLLIFFAIVGGTFAGTFWCTIGALAAEIVGLQDLPAALSNTWLLVVPPTTVSEAITLKLPKKQGSYTFIDAQIFTAIMYLAGALCEDGKSARLKRSSDQCRRRECAKQIGRALRRKQS